ncbi:sporulation protein YtxC [Paenibacillus sp. MBLB4367]|uniref:sporulation protein YtxC n=1 Tax=Paenibacillus sp. MBLB4367 TaxID=3384767 RepID=UPI0039080D10
MDGITITVMASKEHSASALQAHVERLLKAYAGKIRLEAEHFGEFAQIRCERPAKTAWNQTFRTIIRDKIGSAIAAYIVQEEEQELLRSIIMADFAYEDEEEIAKIMQYCGGMIGAEDDPELTTDHSRQRREQLIAHEISGFLKESGKINVHGLLQFRLQSYLEELREIVEYAVDEYLMDKQYQEFISLLKYFVFIQDTKIPEAHLMHKGGNEFVILNEQMVPITADDIDETLSVEWLDSDFNFEDLIVSTLITVAPQHIYIHTREPDVPVIRTIVQIFEDRAKLCNYCRVCKPLLGERSKQDQLSP